MTKTRYTTHRETVVTRVDAKPAAPAVSPTRSVEGVASIEIVDWGTSDRVLFDGLAPRALAEQMMALCAHYNATASN